MIHNEKINNPALASSTVATTTILTFPNTRKARAERRELWDIALSIESPDLPKKPRAFLEWAHEKRAVVTLKNQLTGSAAIAFAGADAECNILYSPPVDPGDKTQVNECDAFAEDAPWLLSKYVTVAGVNDEVVPSVPAESPEASLAA
jgi:hypothetical protein